MSEDLPAAAREELAVAVRRLERPGLFIRLSNLVGAPLEGLLRRLPAGARKAIDNATEAAMRRALNAALVTLGGHGDQPARLQLHRAMVVTSGAIGGVAGLAGLAVELPITTTIIFRSIADIARAEGADPRTPETMAECLEVFALGGPGTADDAAESSYLATRVTLNRAVQSASRYLATAAARGQAPLLLRAVGSIAARFGVVVSWKVAAQAAPVVGAIGAAAVNTMFIGHFQSIARGHFTVRRLERKYGVDLVRGEYRRLLGRLPETFVDEESP